MISAKFILLKFRATEKGFFEIFLGKLSAIKKEKKLSRAFWNIDQSLIAPLKWKLNEHSEKIDNSQKLISLLKFRWV